MVHNVQYILEKLYGFLKGISTKVSSVVSFNLINCERCRTGWVILSSANAEDCNLASKWVSYYLRERKCSPEHPNINK